MTNFSHSKDLFPTLQQSVNNKPLVYLDNAATNQKPIAVINAIQKYYQLQNSNVHRGVHFLSQQATDLFEKSRIKVQELIHANHDYECIFTKGTTDSINLIASIFPFKENDEIIISAMEHHSNIVPWQMACERTGAKLKIAPINLNGEIILEEFEKLLSKKTRFVSITHISNTLGTINPIAEIIDLAHEFDAKVMIDAAQSIAHLPINVQELDCDFLVFSGHKMFGPTGIGILYGKEDILNSLPPYQGGGAMIKEVSFEKTTYNELPFKFEAGTPHIEGVIGLGAAIDFIHEIGFEHIQQIDHKLLTYTTEKLLEIEGLKIIGEAKNKNSVISFVVDNVHPYDIGVLLDKMGIAVRTGHHCTQPLMKFYDISGTVRASFSIYNSIEDCDLLINGVKKAIMMLR